jgi:hypothetical protein
VSAIANPSRSTRLRQVWCPSGGGPSWGLHGRLGATACVRMTEEQMRDRAGGRERAEALGPCQVRLHLQHLLRNIRRFIAEVCRGPAGLPKLLNSGPDVRQAGLLDPMVLASLSV